MDERELYEGIKHFSDEPQARRIWPLVYSAIEWMRERERAFAGAIVGAPAMPEDFE